MRGGFLARDSAAPRRFEGARAAMSARVEENKERKKHPRAHQMKIDIGPEQSAQNEKWCAYSM